MLEVLKYRAWNPIIRKTMNPIKAMLRIGNDILFEDTNNFKIMK